jgi:hypothetical protein
MRSPSTVRVGSKSGHLKCLCDATHFELSENPVSRCVLDLTIAAFFRAIFFASQRSIHTLPVLSSGPLPIPVLSKSVGDAARELEQAAKKDFPPEPEALREKEPPQVRPKAQAALVSPYQLTPDHVKRAFKRINQTVLRTPCDFSPRISPLVGCNLFMKKEHLSITGSYKERGALNKLLQLTDEEKARGVICSSAGNHAQAVSYHSTRLGIDGVIVMPINAPHTKVKSTREFGARVVQAGESFAEAYEHAVALAKAEGRTFIHAFNDPEVRAQYSMRSPLPQPPCGHRAEPRTRVSSGLLGAQEGRSADQIRALWKGRVEQLC